MKFTVVSEPEDVAPASEHSFTVVADPDVTESVPAGAELAPRPTLKETTKSPAPIEKSPAIRGQIEPVPDSAELAPPPPGSKNLEAPGLGQRIKDFFNDMPARPQRPVGVGGIDPQYGDHVPVKGETGEVTKGFVGGMVGTNPKLFGSAVDALGTLAESQTLKDLGGSIEGMSEERLKDFKPNVASTADIQSFTDAKDFAKFQIGQGVATMTPSLVLGTATSAITTNPVVGIAVGAAGPSYIQNLGDVWSTVREELAATPTAKVKPRTAAMAAVVAAVPMAALDALSVGNIAQGFTKEARADLQQALVKRLVAETLKDATFEGLTEATQEVISQWTAAHLSGNALLTRDRIMSVVDNFVGGALSGGVFGAASSAAGAVTDAPPIGVQFDPSAAKAGKRPAGPDDDGSGPAGAVGALDAPKGPMPTPGSQAAGDIDTGGDDAGPSGGAMQSPDAVGLAQAAPDGPLVAAKKYGQQKAADAAAQAPGLGLAPQKPASFVTPFEEDQISAEERSTPPADVAPAKSPTPDQVTVMDAPIPPVETGNTQPPEKGDDDKEIFVALGKKRIHVGSLEEASQQFMDKVSAAGTGASKAPTPLITDAKGNVRGHIADNGRIYAGRPENWTEATPLIYDNRQATGERHSPVVIEEGKPTDITAARSRVEAPTEAQAEAGNYKKGHVRVQGLDVTIENPKGSERSGIDPNGKPWSVKMPGDYGYIKQTVGADDEHMDVYLGHEPHAHDAYVVDQVDADTGEFDEHKIVLGVPDEEAARTLYEAGFSDGRGAERAGAITRMSMPELKEWLASGKTKEPLSPSAYDTNDDRVQREADRLEHLSEKYDFEETYPQPDERQLAALEKEGREHPFVEKGDRQEQVKAVTEDVLAEVAESHRGLRILEEAQRKKVDPRTGKAPAKGKENDVSAYIKRERKALTQQAEDVLGAYEDIFGADAASLVDMEAKRRAVEGRPMPATRAAKPAARGEVERLAVENNLDLQDEELNEAAGLVDGGMDALEAIAHVVERSAWMEEAALAADAREEGLPDEWKQPALDLGGEFEARPQPEKAGGTSAETDGGAEEGSEEARGQSDEDPGEEGDGLDDTELDNLRWGAGALGLDKSGSRKEVIARLRKAGARSEGRIIYMPHTPEEAVAKLENYGYGESKTMSDALFDRFKAALIANPHRLKPVAMTPGGRWAIKLADGMTMEISVYANRVHIIGGDIFLNGKPHYGGMGSTYPAKAATEFANKFIKEVGGEPKGGRKGKATAPEHTHNQGKPLDHSNKFEPTAKGASVTDDGTLSDEVVNLTMPLEDFKKITDEWAALFEEPGKRVNMDKKAAAESELTPEEADARIAEWKAHVRAQGKKYRAENSTKTILSLFDLTGEWSKPYEEAGYTVIRFDIQNGQDIHDFSVEYFNENYDIGEVYGILAATPCTDFASSGARHFAEKDADGRTEASKELVFQTLRTIEYFRPKFWVLENPVGRIGNLTGLPSARLSFNPNNFGADYTKKTMLWGKFNPDLPVAPVAATEGSKMHRLFGGSSQKTKNARSETPEGFAYAFFMANNYIDADPVQRLKDDYPEASGAVEAAYKAGISEDEIRAIMERTYENYEYEQARTELAKAVAEKKGEGAPVAEGGKRRGEVGMKLAPGEVVLTNTNRETTPFPKVDAGTDRKAAASIKRVDNWLMQNALDEARARGDDFNARTFEANLAKPSQADKDSAEHYLFDKDFVFDVPPSPLKDMTNDDRAKPTEPKAPRKPKLQDAGEILAGRRKGAREDIAAEHSGEDSKDFDALMERVRNAVRLPDSILGEGATSGAKFHLAQLRNCIKPFVQLKRLPLVRRHYRRRGVTWTDEVKDTYLDPSRRAAVEGAAVDYIAAGETLADILEGAKTSAEISERIQKALYTRRDGASTSIYSLIPTEAGDAVSFLTDGSTLRLLIGPWSETKELPNRNTPLRRPASRLEDIERQGLPDRRNGKDVDAEDFRKTFGFRGVEFGNWVNSAERQLHVNLAYDSLFDLAESLGIPPRGISLGGTLGLAFGARGHGRHSAHYEPGNKVINLTKTKGDGAVSHEWGHGLDYLLSETPKGKELMDEFKARLGREWDVEAALKTLDGILKGSVRSSRGKYTPLELAQEYVDRFWRQSGWSGKQATKFLSDAASLDKNAANGYWSRPQELFARAFEAWVYDRLDAEDQSSPYLVTDWVAQGVVSKQSGYRGTPYPTDGDREAFADLFNQMMSELTWAEDGKPSANNVKMRPNAEAEEEVKRALKAVDLDNRYRELAEEKKEKARQEAAKKEAADAARRAQGEIVEPKGYIVFDAAEVTDPEQRARWAAPWTAVAQREKPFSAERGFGNTAQEAQWDALRRVGAWGNKDKPNTPRPGAEAKPEPAAAAKAEPAPKAEASPPPNAKPGYGDNNKFVTKDRAAELRERLKAKIRNQLNSGFDPEVLAIGAELAAYHIEAGARRFAEFTKAISADLGMGLNALRPYLRAWYNSGRDLMEDAGQDVSGMDNAEAVRAILAQIDNGEVDGLQGPIPDENEGSSPDDVRGASEGGQTVSARAGDVEQGARDGEGSSAGERDGGAEEGSRGNRVRSTERVPAAERPDASVKGENFVIEPGALAENRGWKQKARDNIRAIELTRQIEAEGRPATRAEQAELARYVGWGGIKGAFPDAYGKFAAGYEDIGKQLKELLTPTEYKTAERSIQYAHYTSETIVRAMWDAAKRMGFDGGAVFEPGMGTGNFAGMMPTDVAARTNYSGLELDHMTARIARLLYPRWGVRRDDFTAAPLPKDAFDLVIGNPPFADIAITSDPDYAKHKFLLHDYFFAKSIDAVRPGGLLMFVTSAGTMNKVDSSAREYLAERADLVGAVRLPGNAFEKNAGTSVTTDIIVLRKKGAEPFTAGVKPAAWLEVAPIVALDKDGKPTRGNSNQYFVSHPEMVLGEEGFFDKLYAGRYAVRAKPGANIEADLRTAVNRMPSNILAPWQDITDRAEVDFGTAEAKEGSYYVNDAGELMQRRGGVGVKVQKRGKGVTGGKSAEEMERIKQLIPIRDALRDVFAADLANDTKNADRARKRLNETYDAFVAKFGPINKANLSYRRPTIIQQESARLAAREEARFIGEPFEDGSFDPSEMIEEKASTSDIARARQAMRERMGDAFDEGSFNPEDMPDLIIDKRPNIDPMDEDPEHYRLRSIEDYDDNTDNASKRDVFFRNIITREVKPQINSANDALLYVLNTHGRVDIPAIAHAAGVTEGEAIEALRDHLFLLPGTDETYVLADEYLSGNVRTKLKEAQAAAQRDPAFRRNVAALEAALPQPLTTSDIQANLGMPWIPPQIIEKFGKEALGLSRLSVRYLPKMAVWTVEGDEYSAAAVSEWGTEDRPAPEIISAALNHQSVVVTRKDSEGKSFKDAEASEAAENKLAEVKEKFRTWLWEDQERADTLTSFYNENFNNLVVREWSGEYLTTPGIASDWKWRPHQTRAIARIIQSGNTYLAHAVGAGKTSEMIGAGMEMRRLGIARKPMYAVPNHMLGQFTKEFYQQYPTARIMVADERSFHTDRRKQFVSDAATSDLDAIIITHSAFGKIPVSADFEAQLIEEELVEYRALLEETKGDTVTRSRVQKQVQRLEERLKGKKKAKDETFTFEEMGVDQTFVDEAHLFRKLDFATKMTGVKGISPVGSKMSWDLFLKTRYLASKTPGRGIVFASGTPITNTMAELYSLSRYMQPGVLEERGLTHFDAWAAAFGDTKTALEQNPAGGYSEVTRFAQFLNVPELSAMVRQIMDVVSSSQLAQYVARPKLKGGQRIMHVAERSIQLERHQEVLAARMKAIQQRRGPAKKGDDIMLSVINDGRHAAIDMRLVEPDIKLNVPSKLDEMVDNVYRIWAETKKQPFHKTEGTGYEAEPFMKGPATQMIFANLGIGKARGFSVYSFIVSELVRRGVPRSDLAVISDYKTHVARARLFNDMNEGKVRILLGSTAKMATGVNAQKRLYAIHNLDPLWFPAEDEQRNGRGIRQGNMNPEIEIHDYSTKGTYDSTMWGLMETKARFIQGFFEGDPTLRSMEDLGEASTYEQAKALSTNDPRIMVLTEKRQALEKATRAKRAFDSARANAAYRIRSATDTIEYAEKHIPLVEQDIAQRVPTKGDAFKGTVRGKAFDERVEFGAAFHAALEDLVAEKTEQTGVPIAEVGGFEIAADVWLDKRGDDGRPQWVSGTYIRRNGGVEREVRFSMSPTGQVRTIENALEQFDGDLAHYQSQKAQAEKDLIEFNKQLAKQYDGQAKIDELAAEISDIEAELRSESDSQPAPSDVQARDLDDEPSLADKDEEPVAVLTGAELGVNFQGPDDMPALRTAAGRWYDENLRGSVATMKDGTKVKFSQRGRNKSVHGKGDLLLRAVPAIRAIIENGQVVLRNDGNKAHVRENIVVVAPVSLDGKIMRLAVSLHRTEDGTYHYNFTFDNAAGGPGIGARLADDREAADSGEGTASAINIFEYQPNIKQSANERAFVAGWETHRGNRRRGADDLIRRLKEERSKRVGRGDRLAPIDKAEIAEIDDFIDFIGREMFSDIGLSVSRKLNGPLGLYRLSNQMIAIFERAIERGDLSNTMIHELWHSLERFVSPEDLQAIHTAFRRALGRWLRQNPWAKPFVTHSFGGVALLDNRTLTREAAAAYMAEYPTPPSSAVTYDRRLGIVTLAKTDENYRYSNAAEFFAEEMLDRYVEHRDKQETGDLFKGTSRLDRLRNFIGRAYRRIVDAVARRLGLREMNRIFANFRERRYDFSRQNDYYASFDVAEMDRDEAPANAESVDAFVKEILPGLDSYARPIVQDFTRYMAPDDRAALSAVLDAAAEPGEKVRALADALGVSMRGRPTPSNLSKAIKDSLRRLRENIAKMADQRAAEQEQTVIPEPRMPGKKPRNRGAGPKELSAVDKALRRAPKLPDPGDFTSLETFFLHPYQIGTLDPQFMDVFHWGMEFNRLRNEAQVLLGEAIEPYMKLSEAQRENVNKALELGRLEGKDYSADETISVTNEGHGHAILPVGETVTLTPEERQGYLGVRAMFDRALLMFKQQALVEAGLGQPGDPRSAEGIRALAQEKAEEYSQNELNALERAADIVDVIEKARRVGYVPFSRYGDYSISVTSGGKVVWFQKIEKGPLGIEREQVAKIRAELAERFPKKQGYVIQATNFNPKLDVSGIQDIDFAVLDEMARRGGAAADTVDAYHEAVQAEWTKQGFRSHFIESRNVPGYEQDFTRSISDYIVGISGYLARRNAMDPMDQAIGRIAPQKVRLRDYAKKYKNYLFNPQEEWARWRQGMFFAYLAANVSSAVVNISQVPLFSFPFLTMFSNAPRAAGALLRASADTLRMFRPQARAEFLNFDISKAPADVRDELATLMREGTLVPMTTLENMGVAAGRKKFLRGVGKAGQAVLEVSSTLFTMAERFNRIATAIAAIRLARRADALAKAKQAFKESNAWLDMAIDGEHHPIDVARFVIDETHFLQGKANRPAAMRGFFAVLNQFKGFMVNALQLQWRMAKLYGAPGKKALAMNMALLYLASGLFGLPGADDLREWLEWLYRFVARRDLDIEKEMQALAVDVLGEKNGPWLGEAMRRGLLRQSGVDVSRRVGMGEILPIHPPAPAYDSLSALQKQLEIAGLPGGVIVTGLRAMNDVMAGDYASAAGDVSRFGIASGGANLAQAYAMTQDGLRSTRGAMVMTPEDLSASDVALRALGFQSTRIARRREEEWMQTRAANAVEELQRSYTTRLARALAAHDKEGADGIIEEIRRWNDGKPAYMQVTVSRSTVASKIKQELQGKGPTIDRQAPKKARGENARIRELMPEN